MSSLLASLVLSKAKALGEAEAADFFRVSEAEVRRWVRGEADIPLSAVEEVFSSKDFQLPSSRFEEANWEGRKVGILLPWYRETHPTTSISVMGLLDRTKMGVLMRWGDAFVVHTRNTLATEFLRESFEWAFWCDSDMIFPFGNASVFRRYTGWDIPDKYAGLHTLNQLLSRRKTLIGGLYFGRHIGNAPPMFAEGIVDERFREKARRAPVDEVIPCTWVATGCLLHHRKVLEDIQARFPQLAPQTNSEPWHFFSNSETDAVEALTKAMLILSDSKVSEAARIAAALRELGRGKEQSLRNSRLQQGEDVTFCKRAASAGHQPYVDLSVLCGHIGDAVFPVEKRAQ